MPSEEDFKTAGKHIFLGLHRAGQSFAHLGGGLIDAMTGGKGNVAAGIDQATDQVGIAYAELGALPEDSPEGRYVASERAAANRVLTPMDPAKGQRLFAALAKSNGSRRTDEDEG